MSETNQKKAREQRFRLTNENEPTKAPKGGDSLDDAVIAEAYKNSPTGGKVIRSGAFDSIDEAVKAKKSIDEAVKAKKK